jgi:hypothetical protein
MEANAERPSLYRSHRADIMDLVARYRLDDVESDDGEEGTTCVYQ